MHRNAHVLFFLIAFFLSSFSAFAKNVTVLSWNIQHFGRTKSLETLEFIAKTVQDYDIIAIQEVVGKTGGVEAVQKLVGILKTWDSEANWSYAISPITSGNPHESERYAYIWKAAELQRVGEVFLYQKRANEIVREPYFASFVSEKDTFTLVNFHAVPKFKNPESEIKYFKFMPDEFPNMNLIFLGDFNTPQSNNVFNPLKKMGYLPALINQKTTVRMQCKNGDCLASEYDNIFYPSKKIKKIRSGVIHYYKEYPDAKTARSKVSDHIPVYLEFSFK